MQQQKSDFNHEAGNFTQNPVKKMRGYQTQKYCNVFYKDLKNLYVFKEYFIGEKYSIGNIKKIFTWKHYLFY